MTIKEWVWNLFPLEFSLRDSYPVNGKGLLQRYLEAITEELDDYPMDKLEKIHNLFNAELIEEPLLANLADFLGNPPDTFGNIVIYRRLLRNLPYLNKLKGTKKGYHMLFGLFGVTITITEDPIAELRYDTIHSYDTGLRYDEGCPPCTGYTITIHDPEEVSPELKSAFTDVDKYKQLIALIKYMEPITASLRGITYEGITTLPQGWWVLTTGIWDSSKYWDNSKYYRNNP